MSAAAGASFLLHASFVSRSQQRRCLRACGAPGALGYLFLTSVVLFLILVVLSFLVVLPLSAPAGTAELIAFCSDATYVAPEEGPLSNPVRPGPLSL